jgi:hypothetical protein
MSLKDLLGDRNITTALIVDDAYDQVPRAEDLEADNDSWANFIADIGEDHDALVQAFPAFDSVGTNELQRSDAFVAAVWNAKDHLRPELWAILFSNYEQATRSDRSFLTKLEDGLKAVGLGTIASGRDIPEAGHTANIIFADLFLGAAQQAADIDRSLERLKPLLVGREADPPLVILMSRSPLLEDKKAAFRDKAKLLGAMFRVYRKSDLIEGTNLERALERLALHRPDALRVAAFLESWRKGLGEASERFLTGVRRLDLSDYGQLREILLTFEGQPLGSYMLDVFDRVLAHEIEGDAETIRAAEELNSIDPSAYPAPHIAGSTDLQDLVYRTIWQNPKRLDVKTIVAAIPVGFGDVLVKQAILNPGQQANDAEPDALVALTPACELVRKEDGAKRILFLAGKLADLTSKTWTYKGGPLKTPIAVLPGDRRMWVRWDVRDYRTLLPAEATSLIGHEGPYKIVLRLRENHALELQQRLLTHMGRVGLVAHMPATFPVGVRAYVLRPDDQLQELPLPKASAEGGICYVGRDERGNEQAKLVLTEPVIDELLTAIGQLTEETTSVRARDTLKRLKAATSLASDLQKGLSAPASDKTGFAPIKADVPGTDGQIVKGLVGMIGRNPPDPLKPEMKHAALVLVLTDEAAPAALHDIAILAASTATDPAAAAEDPAAAPASGAANGGNPAER